MPANPGVIINGVISKWLSSKPSVTEMLTVDANGNVGRQAIPSAPALAWGNITGTLSAQTDLQMALDGKASFVHGHAIGDVTNLSSTLTAIDFALAALDAAKLNTSAFTFANLGSKPTTLSGYGITDAQPVNANLTEIAALTTQPYGRSLLTQADAGAARSTLQLGSLATQNGTISDYLLSTTAASTYLPLVGGILTGGLSGTTGAFSGALSTNGVGGGFYVRSAGSDVARFFAGNGSAQLWSTTDYRYLGSNHTFRNSADSANASIVALNATFSGGIIRSTNGIELRHNDTVAPFCVDFRNRAIIGANHALAFTSNVNAGPDAPVDFLIQRDGTRSIGLYSASIPGASSGAAIVNLYNARNDASNYDRGFIRWNSNVLEIGTERLGSYVTARALALIVDGTQRIRILSTGIALSGGTVSGSNSFMAASIHGEASGTRAVKFCADGGVSSGADSFSHGNVPGYGSGNNTGQNSVTFSGAWASDNTAFSQGYYARSDRFGMKSWANGNFSGSNFGEAQKAVFIARRRTTDATPTTLMLDGASIRLSVNAGEVLGFIVNITGSKSDGTAIAHYVRKGAIKRISNTTTLAYVEAVGTDYEDNAATDVSITADDTNDALQISVTGIAGETWRWVATIEAADLGFGT